MSDLMSRVWDSIEAGTNVMHNNDGALKINVSKKNKKDFIDTFKVIYNNIREGYMKDKEEPLDRHKVAAIIMISIIKCEIVELESYSNTEKRFLGNYILATNCGFSYMLMELNKKLKNVDKQEIANFFFPQAMACETDYYRIFYRNLYFANTNKEWGLNPLDIAERLFLLEYMTLEKNGIDPSILREY